MCDVARIRPKKTSLYNTAVHTEEKAPQAEHVYAYCTATGKGLGRALPLAY